MADVLNTDYAEGLVLPMEDESKIRHDWLETFRYDGPRQRVCYELKEFAAVCPWLAILGGDQSAHPALQISKREPQ